MADRNVFFAIFFLGLLAHLPYSLAVEQSVAGQGAASAEPLSSAEEGEPTGRIDIANAGESGAVFTGRDPFWPVGYVPASSSAQSAKSGNGVAGQSQEEQSALDLGGLSAEEQRVIRERMRLGGVIQQAGEIWAILNNQLVREGEAVTIDTGRMKYLFLVKRLTPDRIVLESMQDP